ncbi:MAG: CocE/NonD family hydrolase, partial [Bacteroidota bacterium]|nr:CocE/NonD family hydrolase [Bacteroidota bacterium]
MKRSLFAICFLLCAIAQGQNSNASFVKDNFTKMDTTIAMRDGIKLYTVIYIPKDGAEKYPFLMERTPYSAAPYGADNYAGRLGPGEALMREKYIFVYQDVRGRYMSEGVNLEVTPYIAGKKNTTQVDESSDTYDT